MSISIFKEKGDVTIYEYRTGTAPTLIETSQLDLKALEETEEEDVIDFDLDLNIETDGADIDWGISTDDATVDEKSVNLLIDFFFL